jgi:ankyrin repeat protein
MKEANSVTVNLADKHGLTALHYAAKFNRSEVLSLLIEKGATIDAVVLSLKFFVTSSRIRRN